MKKAAIIGSGIAGIACSVRLANKGYAVDVFEQNGYPGGKLSTFTLGKYRFDAGPSLFTMPHFVEELFTLCGEDVSAHFSYKKKKIACEYFWEDGLALTAYGNLEHYLNEVEQKLGVSPQVLQNYLTKAKKKYDLTAGLFLEKSLHKLSTYISADTLKALLQIHTLELQANLNKVNENQLQEPHLVQLYNRYATYNGSDPYQTPGIMSLVQHLEQHYGTFVPEKGMGAITQSVYALAKRQGVKFHFNQKVERIQVHQKKATGITINNENHNYDLVVSNMDVVPSYRYLMPDQKAPEKTLQQERSSSAVIFYWGIKTSFPQLDLHNIFFSADYREEFRCIFEDSSICDDPTVYVNITSKDVPEDAPAGCENWFVMINTPADKGQDWEKLVAALRIKVIRKIERILKTSIEDKIEVEEVLTPPLIQSKTQSHLGALYGASSNNTMAAFWRHPNFSQRIKNLYFCGGSVHPGGGIPLCLLSAKIVSEQIPKASYATKSITD